MTFNFMNLKRLGNQVSVSIPKDSAGFLGRECPQGDCEGYFKIKPGTGLTGKNLPCHCPYCGHSASQDHFWTKEQLEYARSVAFRQITDAIHRDLKSLEFEVKPKGGFGIGVKLEVKKGRPVPIRYYREQQLETHVTCDTCTLEYAVYGVFGFCPDCGKHNSLQILQKNLALARKELELASTQADPDLQRYLVEDALENCMSAFDGFARETCRIRAASSADFAKCQGLSFQNLPRSARRLKELFGIELQDRVNPPDWNTIHTAFMKRHLIAHRAGVVDQQYLDETGESSALLGRRVHVTREEVEHLTEIVEVLGRGLLSLLPPIT